MTVIAASQKRKELGSIFHLALHHIPKLKCPGAQEICIKVGMVCGRIMGIMASGREGVEA